MKNIILLLPVLWLLALAGPKAYGQGEISSSPMQHFSHTDTSRLALQYFSVTGKDKKAILRWKTDSLPGAESFYAVERSSNGTDFSLVGITRTVNGGWTEFLDESPPQGKIFYRVKLSSGQTSQYSEMVAAMPLPDLSCKFYPNPVDKMLIIKSESSLELQISDQLGKPLISDQFSGGLKVLDVAALEPGIYVITLFQKETGRKLVEKLVKK